MAYWRERGYRHDVLLDGYEVMIRYGFAYQPAVTVIDGVGRIAFMSAGADANRNDDVREAIRRALDR